MQSTVSPPSHFKQFPESNMHSPIQPLPEQDRPASYLLANMYDYMGRDLWGYRGMPEL